MVSRDAPHLYKSWPQKFTFRNQNTYILHLDIDDVSDIEEIDDPVEPIHSIENIVNSESPEPKHKIVRPGFTDFTRFEQERTSRPSNTEYGSIERLRNMQHNISFAPQVK